MSWAASSATPEKTIPTAARPRPSASESGAASGKVTRLSVTSVPVSTLATSATRTVAAVVARRPTAAARSISSRPDSSSARVWRTTRNIDIRPIVIAPKAVACQVTCPPIVSSARAGPVMAMKAALASIATAAVSNSSCVA